MSGAGTLENLLDATAEKAMLCCAMRGGPDLIVEILAEVDEAAFADVAHRQVWDVIVDFVGDDKPVGDVLLIERALKDKGALEEIGGRRMLDELMNFVPSAGAWRNYAEILNDFAVRRRIRAAGLKMQEMAYDREILPEEITEGAEETMAELRDGGESHVKTSSELMQVVIESIETKYANRGRIVGVPLGYPDIDRVIMGMEPGEFMIVGGRPSMGKTAMLMGFIERVSIQPPAVTGYPTEPIPGMVFSLEMPDVQIGTRAVIGLAGAMQKRTYGSASLDLGKARSGLLARADFPALMKASEVINAAPIVWDDEGEQTIGDIKAKIRLAVRKSGVRVVYLDYLQLVKPLTKAGQREERLGIAEVCAGLKAVAKQTGVCIVALAQTSRAAEENRGKKPFLKDFDGSSAIEKFGDYCAFVHRESKVRPWEFVDDSYRDLMVSKLPDPSEWNWQFSWSRVFTGDCPEDDFYELSNEAQLEVRRQRAREVYESRAEFLIRKNRHGGEPELPLIFDGPLARFESCTNHLYSNNPDERQPSS